MSQQKITDKVLSLLEWLEGECPINPKLDQKMGYYFAIELKERLYEIKLESFAQVELNKCDHSRLRGQVGNDYVVCLDCGKEIN